MGTAQVNLVYAIAANTQRVARNRSAVLRTGKVIGAVSSSTVPVSIGGATHYCFYGSWYLPHTNDIVTVLCDNDRYIVLGRIADANDASMMRYRNGHVTIGEPGDTNAYSLYLDRVMDSKQYQAQLSLSATGANGIALTVWEAGVAVGSLLLDAVGQVTTGDRNTTRPLPFATQAGQIQVPTAGTTNATVAFTFTPGRFTQTPYLQVTCATSVALNATTRYTSQSATGVTVGLASTANMTPNYYVSWFAFQATSGSAGGLRDAPIAPGTDIVTVTCPTEGCPSYGIPIDIYAGEEVTAFACGVCAEYVPEAGLQRRRS